MLKITSAAINKYHNQMRLEVFTITTCPAVSIAMKVPEREDEIGVVEKGKKG